MDKGHVKFSLRNPHPMKSPYKLPHRRTLMREFIT